MSAQYIDCEGSFVTKDEISSAFHDGRAVLVHWYGDGSRDRIRLMLKGFRC